MTMPIRTKDRERWNPPRAGRERDFPARASPRPASSPARSARARTTAAALHKPNSTRIHVRRQLRLFAESPNRIFVLQRGEYKLPNPVPPAFAGFADRLASTSQRHRRPRVEELSLHARRDGT